MSSLLLPPLFQASDKNGKPLDGAKLYLFIAETTTVADAFLTIGLETDAKHTNPIVADASGHFTNIYVPPGVLYKTVLTDKNDVEISTKDNIPPYISSAGGTLPISGGGTGEDTVAGARSALGAASASDVTALTETVSFATTAQDEPTWEEGVSDLETVTSPAKIKAAIEGLQAPQSGVPDAILWDEKPLGSHGGSSTANTEQIRDLNQKHDPNGTITLNASNGQFTPSKSGYVVYETTSYSSLFARVSLFSVTDNSKISSYNLNSYSNNTVADNEIIKGRSFVEGGKTYRIIQTSSAAKSTDGLGRANNIGDNEMYTILEYWQNNGA